MIRKFFAWSLTTIGLTMLIVMTFGYSVVSDAMGGRSLGGVISIVFLMLSIGIYQMGKVYFVSNKMPVGKKILILFLYALLAFMISFIVTYPFVLITENEGLYFYLVVIFFLLLIRFPNPEELSFLNKNDLNMDIKSGNKSNSTFGDFLRNNKFTGRISDLNLGVQRLLLVIGILLSLILSIKKYEFFKYFPDDFFLVILFSILLFIGYWVIVRISLWIYDGFKEGDKNK